MDPRQLLRQQFLDTVDRQLLDGDPPETALVLNHLKADGYSEQEAKEMISACVASEMFHVMQSNEPFNRERYIGRLANLPELPE